MIWLRRLWRWLLIWLHPMPVPPSLYPVLTGEVFMSGIKDGLVYSVDIPELPKQGDLVSQILCVHYDGKESELPVDSEGGVTQFMVPQDSDVSIHLKYVDDGGTKAEGPLFSFKALDTINTFTPPGFGEVKLVDEVFDVDWDTPIMDPPAEEPEDDLDETDPEILPPSGPTI